MARYKPQDRNSLLLPVVLSEQIILEPVLHGAQH